MMLKLNKLLIIVFLIFLYSNIAVGQSSKTKNTLLKDTTIFLDELVFNSDLEEKFFNEIYLNKSNDYFSLIYLVEKGANADVLENSKSKLYDKINSFKAKNIKSKGEKKSIKLIYKEVHNTFFKKYQLINHFDNVFTSGLYNCLSASFLYSLVLEELKIPYQINVLPDHVNLTAYPESHKILLETTDPVKGYFSFNKKFREKYVANLVAYKMIDESDLIQSNVDDLFQKYYYTKEVVNLKQLVGAQYYNDGLYLMDKEKYSEAIEQLEKSIALYPSLNAARILVVLYSSEIGESKYKVKKHLDYLVRVLRYEEVGVDQNSVKFEFKKIAEHHLMDNKDTTYLNEVHDLLRLNIENDTLKDEVTEFYYAQLGDYYRKELNFKKAADNYLKVVLMGKSGEIAKSSYAHALVLHVDGFSNKKKALNYLLEAEKKYDGVLDNRLYLSYKADVYCYLMSMCFERNDFKKGVEYQNALEQIFDNNDVKISENNVGIAYATAGSYYFRKGSRNKAKALFNKGLEYAPENYELESRLKMINY